MITFRTRYGMVTIPGKKRSKGKKAKRRTRRNCEVPAAEVKANPAAQSKKIGRYRVTRKGRTVTAAGAKRAYPTLIAAKAAYTRIKSMKALRGFVAKYGKVKTKIAVGVKKTSKKAAKRRAPKRAKKRAKKRTRRNAPMSASEAASLRRLLAKHKYF